MASTAARASITGVRCIRCQRHVIHTFIDSLVPLPARVRPQAPQSTALSPSRHLRRFSTISPHNSEQQKPEEAEVSSANASSPNEAPEQKPWYLQDTDRAAKSTNPFAERQKLPDLPNEPPPALQEILRHLSIDIGLDYLSLIDLRTLDPPAALGGNLIMIIGTARSEKHLNVSADRFCRWLRTKYKMTPFADGLLGRNELKLKLKRKARRSKMLGAYGARDNTDHDDGITTGWICVNAGEIEDHPEHVAAKLEAIKDVVGFGTQSTGVKIVVQMLTEDKRGEIDLEGLWQGFLNKALKKSQRLADAENASATDLDEEPVEVDPASPHAAAIKRSTSPGLPGPQARITHGAVRGIHTSTAFFNAAKERPPIDLRSTTSFIPEPPRSIDDAKLHLTSLITRLTSLPTDAALEALGTKDTDHDTEFKKSFHAAFPTFPTAEHWHTRLELYTYALMIEHPGYTKHGLMEEFHTMHRQMVTPSEGTFHLVLETLLTAPHNFANALRPAPAKGLFNGSVALKRSLGWAFEVTELMEAHGLRVDTPQILSLLHTALSDAFAPAPVPPPTPLDQLPVPAARRATRNMHHARPGALELSAHSVRFFQHQFHKLLAALESPEAESDALLLQMLATYARQQSWSHFWQTWARVPALRRAHAPEMYALLFDGVADSGNAEHAAQALRQHVELMPLESAPVAMRGDVARAALRCLEVARPDLREQWWRETDRVIRAAAAAAAEVDQMRDLIQDENVVEEMVVVR